MNFASNFQKIPLEDRKVLLFTCSFVGTHTVLSSSFLRSKLIKLLNKGVFSMIYNIISVATFVPATYLWLTKTRNSGDNIGFISNNSQIFKPIGTGSKKIVFFLLIL